MNKKRLTDSKVFCMAPWVHQHVLPTGHVTACCWSSSGPQQHLGRLGSDHSLEDLWNADSIKSLRKNMLNDHESTITCQRCYELEKSGSMSLRQKLNRDFSHHINVVNNTSEDGVVSQHQMPFVDIRFSNLCNFKCRSCGPFFSSAWGKEINQKQPVLAIADQRPSIMDEIIKNIQSIEEVYFAGGEPLLMEEHYILLNQLIRHKKENVRLTYSTNFSHLTFKNYDVLKLWKNFPHIHLGISLDGSHERAAYIRKGTLWDDILINHKRLVSELPHVKINVESTISILNVWHIADFVEDWIYTGKIDGHSFFAILLQEPSYLCIKNLPTKFKHEVNLKLSLLQQKIQKDFGEKASGTYNSIESIRKFMNSGQENPAQIELFKKQMFELDQRRQESLLQCFPELSSLLF